VKKTLTTLLTLLSVVTATNSAALAQRGASESAINAVPLTPVNGPLPALAPAGPPVRDYQGVRLSWVKDLLSVRVGRGDSAVLVVRVSPDEQVRPQIKHPADRWDIHADAALAGYLILTVTVPLGAGATEYACFHFSEGQPPACVFVSPFPTPDPQLIKVNAVTEDPQPRR